MIRQTLVLSLASLTLDNKRYAKDTLLYSKKIYYSRVYQDCVHRSVRR